MKRACPYCGATEDDTSGCRHCDPALRTSRVHRSEVSFGAFGRALETVLFAAVVTTAFLVLDHTLNARPLAWWVLATLTGVLGPVALLSIWKPVRRPHRD